ncbi:DNA polymerase III subunit alpha (plasmid) [Paenibacillus rhizovicinus]|uniref:DNA-directed DNA polymerase n=1 Tax=Paenibacillus rhizovicinus TaxID=2704463 RepID=A0A6C0PCZ6_9BACL|nr:DNA polymerase III subunit alpha [Paenibacillus rhizovicinus]QHW35832.1 DNA polymerase III subunit alpha [Paenibacillus rhizovicinus]
MCIHVHLHVHSEHSALDGLSQVHELVERAKEIGSPALAITDHGVCGAIPDFISSCLKQGIKPIPGCEAYMTKDRLLKGEFLKEKRTALLEKYNLKDKPLKQFIRHIERNPQDFETEARTLLMDWIMNVQEDLFTIHQGKTADEQKIAEFREEIYDYLLYDNYHLVLIAVNNQGLEDLYEIVSDAHINGFYSDPRTDLSFIRSHNLGANIIATSACLGSWLSRLALAGRMDEAKAFIQECKETFHSFYLEKQATMIPDQVRLNALLDQLAIETNTPKILTTDVHYAQKDDYDIHDILVASSTGKCIHDEDRMRYAHEFWMKSEEEIRENWNDEEAIANTYKIAELVNVSLPDKPLLPRYPINGDETSEQLLEKMAWNGLFQKAMKYADVSAQIERYSQQLKYELGVINKLGFADYHLIVADFIQWAKNNGYLVGPGRGSAAGSLVCYCIQITTLDPIKHNLMFERFLDPERAEYPDIDIDFSYAGARAVQMYLKEKYGIDRVAQIGTIGTLAARSAIRKVGKTLGFDLDTQDGFAKSISERALVTYSDKRSMLEQAYNDVNTPMVKVYADQYPDWWKAARKLEGHIDHVGTHAGGIVLSPDKITKRVPLRLDKDALETTMFDMEWIEKLLVKFDILKIDALDVIKLTMEYAGIWGVVDIDDIDLNDPKVYQDVYQALNLAGIFQCESDLYQGIIKEMRPSSFDDISVIVALGRPGPMDLIPSYINRKFGRERIVYPVPELEEILKDTFGIWTYQEQIMKASIRLGGFTRGQSNILRKGISKKKHDIMSKWIDLMIYGSEWYKQDRAKVAEIVASYANKDDVPSEIIIKYDPEYMKVPHLEGAVNRGFSEEALLKIKADWVKFGDYCFNLAHSACYAKLSIQTAWLKTYYPVEFMAALMTISEGKKKENIPKNVIYMKECEEMKIKILPPDINRSNASWTPERKENIDFGDDSIGYIRYGLASIAGISSDTVEEIISKRPYESVEALVFLTNGVKVNKTKVVNLIKVGAFDSINKGRNQLLRTFLQSKGDKKWEEISAQTNKKHILDYERELLGTSVTIKSRWDQIPEGKTDVHMTGVVFKYDVLTSKKGNKYAEMWINTAEDVRKVVVFSKIINKHGDALRENIKVQVVGKKQKDDLVCDSLTIMTRDNEKWEVDIA